jgi:hypothetical protein
MACLLGVAPHAQAPYNFGEAQVCARLRPGNYLIVPSLYDSSKCHGPFFLTMFTTQTAAVQRDVVTAAELKVR